MTNEPTKIDLNKIAEYWQSEVAPQVLPNSCVLAVRLVSKALNTLDVPHQITACDALAMNDEAWLLQRQGISVTDWSPTAWSVGAVSNPNAVGTNLTMRGGYAGHLIVTAQQHLIDLTAGQFDRPSHGIVTGGSLIIPFSEIPTDEQGSRCVPIKQGRYLLRPAQYPSNYAHGTDWEYAYRKFLRGLLHHLRGDVYV